MPLRICVYSSSSERLSQPYQNAAVELAECMAKRGHTLVYGGGNIGLMGIMARTMHLHGGRVVGVIPEKLRERELAYDLADELIVTSNMRDRKAEMEARSDAFIALPGGFGTLEELVEVITLRLLEYHAKPVALVNINGYYDALLLFFAQMAREGFSPSGMDAHYHLANDSRAALAFIESNSSGE